MNRHIARALLLDAYHQVLDNMVFRILLVLGVIIVLPTFLIAIKPEGLDFLFGWKTVSYSDMMGAFNQPSARLEDVHIAFAQGVQDVIVQFLGGTIGIFFSIAATAFFVPRMLEKGAADTLFSKPVSRWLLLVSRYFVGLVFVGILAFMLVFGVWLGMALRSDYSDPAFLWNALTLVYIFALIHAFSTVVAVLTRSSVAAILCTLLFFVVNGCVHTTWVGVQYSSARDAEVAARADDDAEKKSVSPVLAFLRGALDVLHYPLPKTTDADMVVARLRVAVGGPEYVVEDRAGALAVLRDPEGFERVGSSGPVDLGVQPVEWIARNTQGQEIGRVTLSRRSRVVEPDGKATRPKRQSRAQAASELVKSVSERPSLRQKPERDTARTDSFEFEVVRWSEIVDGVEVEHRHTFLPFESHMFELDLSQQADALTAEQRDERFEQFLRGFRSRLDTAAALSPDKWYARRLSWTAPLKFNLFFSIGSSLAFVMVMLGIAYWRLKRIDF